MAERWLRGQFGGRLGLTLGDSRQTVPALARAVRAGAEPPCDAVFVDGGHLLPIAYPDMRSFRCGARRGALMVADDCDFAGRTGKIGAHLAYRAMLDEGRVAHLAGRNFTAPDSPIVRLSCVGTFL